MGGQRILETVLSQGRRVLLEPEAYEILSSYNIPVPRYKVVSSIEEAESVSVKVGYPLVLKIVSPDIIHKSDVGGVKVGINDVVELRESYRSILCNVREKAPNARIAGVLVKEMAPKSVEVVVGMLRDPTFGPTVMFGLGGVLIEIMKDVVFRIAPVSREEALGMIAKVKGYPLLTGFRGSAPLDVEAVAELISTVSNIAVENPVIDQMDLNPVMVYDRGLALVDARIILKA
jgi:acetyl-CoA synthetase (ADP-forming)